MADSPLHLGIDLGTTNSAAAVFDGSRVTLVRTRSGGTLTPSVVRIDGRGNVTVGERARRMLDTDPNNTRSEFKRVMGTERTFDFAAAKVSKRPEELSAEVLRAIRADVEDQVGVAPAAAVVSVPALFELPQIAATSEAARLAGFERLEVIQEPVASAIAAGWSVDDPGRHWLVYDLGGGTFDASLLETQEGLLRVVGHDGDNFLGGRDLDAALVELVLGRLAEDGVRVDRADPAHAVALRRLRFAAEEAKIELARGREASIVLPGGFVVGGEPVDIDVVIDRATFEGLAAPLVDRSLSVCLRLLKAHGLGPADLDRVILVGGPTSMPLLRSRVAEVLGAPFGVGLDPMTLVAQGAALFAGTAGVDGRPKVRVAAPAGAKVWLQHPAVTADLSPYVVGRVVDGPTVAAVRVTRPSDGWTSAAEPLDEERAFALPVAILPRQTTELRIVGLDAAGVEVPLHPPTFRIVHGLTVTDPPLARSVGVALADDSVRVYVERGSPLPMRRTFTHRTVETVLQGSDDVLLRVPIVQGEFALAHLCRLIGSIEVTGKELKANLPAGAELELTVELDRGGRLAARAFVPTLDQAFEHVAHLVVPRMSVEALTTLRGELQARARSAQAGAFRRQDRTAVEKLAEALRLVEDTGRELELATGGDADAAEKARRMLVDADGLLAELEADAAWPELEERVQTAVERWTRWVARHGTDTERKVFADHVNRAQQLLTARNAPDVERQLSSLRGIGWGCYLREPGVWDFELAWVAGRITELTDVPAARAILKEGQAAKARKDPAGVEKAVRGLWALLPPDAEDRAKSHDSGVQ